MARKKTPGLVKLSGLWHIDKRINGQRVCQSTGTNQLEKELSRKNNAMAETAALLVLRKKANAIWGSGEDV